MVEEVNIAVGFGDGNNDIDVVEDVDKACIYWLGVSSGYLIEGYWFSFTHCSSTTYPVLLRREVSPRGLQRPQVDLHISKHVVYD